MECRQHSWQHYNNVFPKRPLPAPNSSREYIPPTLPPPASRPNRPQIETTRPFPPRRAVHTSSPPLPFHSPSSHQRQICKTLCSASLALLSPTPTKSHPCRYFYSPHYFDLRSQCIFRDTFAAQQSHLCN